MGQPNQEPDDQNHVVTVVYNGDLIICEVWNTEDLAMTRVAELTKNYFFVEHWELETLT